MKHMTAISRSPKLPTQAQNFAGIFEFFNDLIAFFASLLVLATDKRAFEEGAGS